LRLDVHTVLKQVDYDHQRMQYNTVVSGAMKMLNAMEDFNQRPSSSAAALLKRSASRCAVLPGHTALTHALSGKGYADAYGDLLDAAWPEVDAFKLLQKDEIELMLQMAKLRGSVTVLLRQTRAAIDVIDACQRGLHQAGG
jgi:leucyl-tRNA synthetase